MVMSNYLNVRDLLGHDVVVMPNAALPQIEAWLAVEAAVAEAGEDAVQTGGDAVQAGEGNE
jgi:hypothetical protein